MNDILRHSGHGSIPAQASNKSRSDRQAAAGEAQHSARTWKRRLRGLFHRFYNFCTSHSLAAPLPFLAIAGLLALSLLLTTVYTTGYVVAVDGVTVGTVKDQDSFSTIMDHVEERATNILGYDYQFTGNVTFERALVKKNQLSTVSSFETYLFDQVGEVMKSYVLSVNGTNIGASEDRGVLSGVLEEIKSQYEKDTTVSAEFVEPVTIAYEYTATALEQDADSIRSALTANTTGDTSYTVVSGDTYSTIAYQHNMSLSELMALNPQASLDRLMVGDVLTVSKEVPLLSVRTVDTVTYTESIACPVEQREDSSLYKGQTKVISQGVPGTKQVTADVTSINGVEQSRTVTSTVTLQEPTSKIVAVGTKEKPKTAATGRLQWPLSGRITSNFGYRKIFGKSNFHSALDIAAPYGTAIHAADGGTVTFAGTKGTFGKIVIIDHGNGMQTYYAHCSSLLVSKGDKVAKGQTIAKVGQTGRATGNHCHFEVVINGNSVNPRSYLP